MADRDLWLKARVDPSLARHICQIEDVVVLLLERTVRPRSGREELVESFFVAQ